MFCFIIPTYNEAANITPLLTRLAALYPEPDAAFLIVDDNSPDGTGRLVQDFAQTDRRVHLLTGRKGGLGLAYRRGMAYAIAELKADIILCMDADFQHDPADARRLLARIESGAAVALGSRYIPGGGVTADWQGIRYRLSRQANRLAGCLTGLGEIRDCTGGFRAIRADARLSTALSGLTVRGYAFQLVILHRLHKAGAAVVEEPILFHAREQGQTKLGIRDLLEFCYWTLCLRFGSC